MIDSDEKLQVVRDQLARAEAALASLRRNVLPKNKSLYFVMAESCVDTIAELRELIDAYLGNAVIAQAVEAEGQRGLESEDD